MTAPVRRDPRLVPLSHDHHTALARAREVTLSLDGVQPQEPDVLAARMAAFFTNDLIRHFEAEECHLLPPFVARVGENHPLAAELKRQHAEIRTLAAALDGGEGPEETRLKAWSEAITAHVRWEEREWFNAVQDALSEDELDAIGAALEREGPACPM